MNSESKMSKSECERATDYTLPPLPAYPEAAFALTCYGKQCAEAARAPLLARIAELNGQIERQAAVLRHQREQIAELEADAKRWRVYRTAEPAIHQRLYRKGGSGDQGARIDAEMDAIIQENGNA